MQFESQCRDVCLFYVLLGKPAGISDIDMFIRMSHLQNVKLKFNLVAWPDLQEICIFNHWAFRFVLAGRCRSSRCNYPLYDDDVYTRCWCICIVNIRNAVRFLFRWRESRNPITPCFSRQITVKSNRTVPCHCRSEFITVIARNFFIH